jgi:lactococcin 972 family bacteriocin
VYHLWNCGLRHSSGVTETGDLMKKRTTIMTAAAVAAVIIAGPAMAASASSTEVLGAGVAAGGVVIAGTASGETTGSSTRAGSGDGSFWQWGVGRDDVYSNYFREKSCHGATAVGRVSKKVTNVPGGRYAKALTPKKASGNQAFYHNC